jgi:hypothetical protein
VIFGGLEDSWDYDAMDTMTVSVGDAPRPDEVLLVVAFLGGTRPNARIAGASQAQVTEAVRKLRSGKQRSLAATSLTPDHRRMAGWCCAVSGAP